MAQPVKVLSIGGTDPCGAYGLVTDLKVFTGLGAHGMGAVTVVTAQNSVGWYGAEGITALFLAQQLDAVLSDYGVDAVKTGFLGRPEIVQVVADKLRAYGVQKVVVDPVLVNQRGRRMFGDEVTAVYQAALLPLATVITPNVDELAVLAGTEQAGVSQMAGLAERFNTAVLLTGLENKADATISDWLITPHAATPTSWKHTYIDTPNTAGSGDTLSAALAVYLAQGLPLDLASSTAIQFTQRALQRGAPWRLGQGSGPLGLWRE